MQPAEISLGQPKYLIESEYFEEKIRELDIEVVRGAQ